MSPTKTGYHKMPDGHMMKDQEMKKMEKKTMKKKMSAKEEYMKKMMA